MDENDNKVPTIVITKIPYLHQNYFQWFLTGLYILEKNEQISLKFRLKNPFRLMTVILKSEFICKVLFGIEYYIINLGIDKRDYNLEGYVVSESGKKYFCMDCSDAPYSFDSKLLEKVSIYFKMQCPIEFNPKGFNLTPNVVIPWCDRIFKTKRKCGKYISGERAPCQNLFENLHKVKPAMIGIRRLSWSNSHASLFNSYQHNIQSQSNKSRGKAMCYFGSAAGPVTKCYSPEDGMPDYINEAEIMKYYGGSLHHPNVKRMTVNNIMRCLGSEYDARLIHDGSSNFNNGIVNDDLIIPLEKFAEHVSKFEYNVNISGYRMSIPNRFIDSFMVGTAIFTDKLSVKWYLPFDNNEVIETVPMGYLPNEEVDWDKYKSDLISLPTVNRDEVLKLFNEKWAPDVFAKYVVDTLYEDK